MENSEPFAIQHQRNIIFLFGSPKKGDLLVSSLVPQNKREEEERRQFRPTTDPFLTSSVRFEGPLEIGRSKDRERKVKKKEEEEESSREDEDEESFVDKLSISITCLFSLNSQQQPFDEFHFFSLVDGAVLVVSPSFSPSLFSSSSTSREFQSPGFSPPPSLYQMLYKRVVPILFIDNLDQLFASPSSSSLENGFRSLSSIIQEFNFVFEKVNKESGLSLFSPFSPLDGTVLFGSLKENWGFSLDRFVNLYEKKFPTINRKKLREYLWGDFSYNEQNHRWESLGDNERKRGFIQFILEPLQHLHKAIKAKHGPSIQQRMELLLSFSSDPLPPFNSIFSSFLSLSCTLFSAIAISIPPPSIAQKFRAEVFFKEELKTETIEAVRICDPHGPLIIYISPVSLPNFGIARVLSGTLCKESSQFYVNNEEQKHPWKLYSCQHSSDPEEQVSIVTTGQIFLFKTESKNSGIGNDHPAVTLRSQKICRHLPPVFSQTLYPRLVQPCLHNLSANFPRVSQTILGTGDIELCSDSEIELLRTLGFIQMMDPEIQLFPGGTMIKYRETVTANSNRCYRKSSNKRNLIEVEASPLPESAIHLLENLDDVVVRESPKKWIDDLKVLGVSVPNQKALWCHKYGNILISEVQETYEIRSIRDYIQTGFRWAVSGILIQEKMRGVCFRITNLKPHPDLLRSGASQIIPMTGKALLGAFFRANYDLIEPGFEIEVDCFPFAVADVVSLLAKKNSEKLEKKDWGVIAWVKCQELIGISQELSSIDGVINFEFLDFQWGSVILKRGFDEFQKTISAIRKRKQMSDELQSPEFYATDSEETIPVNVKPARK